MTDSPPAPQPHLSPLTPPARRGAHRAAWAALSIATFACVLAARYPPIQDFPAHLLVARIVAAPELFASAYEVDLRPSPYVAFYALAALLQRFATPLVAGKLIVAAAVTSLPWSMLVLVRALGGRPSLLHLVAFPICFSSVYYTGLLNYLIGLPFVLLGLAAAARGFESGSRQWNDAAFFACAVAACLAHPIALALLAILTAALFAARWRAARAAGAPRPRLPIAPFAALAALVAWTLVVSEGAGAATRDVRFVGPVFTTRFLIDPFVGTYAAPWHWLSRFAYAAIAAVAVAAARRAWRARGSVWAAPASRPLAAILAVSLVLLYVLPFRVGVSGNYFNVRLALLAHLLGVALAGVLAGEALRRVDKALLGVTLALLLANAASAHVRFDREARAAEGVFAAMAPGRSVLPLPFEMPSRVFQRRHWNQLYLHFHDYYHVEKGGIDPYIGDWNPLFPFRYTGPRLAAPGEYRPRAFRFEAHGAAFDYILARGTPTERVMEDLLANTRLVSSVSPWLLVEPLREREAGGGGGGAGAGAGADAGAARSGGAQ